MGFSIMFMRLGGSEILDADRAGLAAFLASEGLVSSGGSGELLRVSDGAPLAFDGYWTDLHLDDVSQEEPVSGGIDHATLSPDEVSFIFHLCVAGKMLVINPQGDPLYIVPDGTHERDDVPDPDDVAWVQTPEEFAHALGVSFGAFASFRDRVVEGSATDAAE
ncbi:MAG: hypothetical protein PIR02_18625 [Microbacterium enclense]